MDFRNVHEFFLNLAPIHWEWVALVGAGSMFAFAVINGLVGLTAFYTWFERRMLGRFQGRLGPNRWGPFGLLQPLADVLKLITKEDIIPATADKKLFIISMFSYPFVLQPIHIEILYKSLVRFISS